MVAGPGSIHQF